MKIILIGKTGSGKTTLIQRIEKRALVYAKTQMLEYHLNFIDTPGEYLENRRFYKALIVSAVDADVIGFVHDCTDEQAWIPPAFSSAFAKPAVGLLTKTDAAKNKQAIKIAQAHLVNAGAERIFEISALSGAGIPQFTKFLLAKPFNKGLPRHSTWQQRHSPFTISGGPYPH